MTDNISESDKDFPLEEDIEDIPDEKEIEDFDKDVSCPKFDLMGLKDGLLRGIYGIGFNAPSEIQAAAILPMAAGRDLIAQAQSGTGKTCAFVTGVLQQIDEKLKACQGLILCPTRELADQIFKILEACSIYLSLKIGLCRGGQEFRVSTKAVRPLRS
jgi:translation initiation factor 4A